MTLASDNMIVDCEIVCWEQLTRSRRCVHKS